MNEQRGILKLSYNLGTVLVQSVVIQWYILLYTLRGAVLFGFFPSISVAFRVINRLLDKKADTSDIKIDFKEYYKETFKESNIVGYVLFLVGIFLYIDLKVSGTLIKIPLLHYFLILLTIFFIGVAIYAFPAMARYQLEPLQYIRQAFFLFIMNPIDSVAILLAVALLPILWTLIPILLFASSVPMVVFAVAWFSRQSIDKSEERIKRYEED